MGLFHKSGPPYRGDHLRQAADFLEAVFLVARFLRCRAGAFSSTSPNPRSTKNFLAAAGEALTSALVFLIAFITILYAVVVMVQI
jgi:hypothetical protein